jgi:hypothetical protein
MIHRHIPSFRAKVTLYTVSGSPGSCEDSQAEPRGSYGFTAPVCSGITLQPHEYRNAVSSDSLGLLPTATTPGHVHPIGLNSEGVPSLPRLCIC